MSILCKLFGHTFESRNYGNVKRYAVDNIGREHASVRVECDRCDEEYTVCHIHLPERQAEKKVRKRLEEAETLLQCSSGDGI